MNPSSSYQKFGFKSWSPRKFWNETVCLCIFLYLIHSLKNSWNSSPYQRAQVPPTKEVTWKDVFVAAGCIGVRPPQMTATGVFQGEIIEFLGNSSILGFLMLDNWNILESNGITQVPSPQKSAESMGISNYLASWWLNQPLWKICSSKWVHLPQFSGWKFQKYLKPSSS